MYLVISLILLPPFFDILVEFHLNLILHNLVTSQIWLARILNIDAIRMIKLNLILLDFGEGL